MKLWNKMLLTVAALVALVGFAIAPALAQMPFAVNIGYRQVNAATASTTATVAQMGMNGFNVLDMTGSLAAAGNLTTPTAAAILANNTLVGDGQSYVLRVINETAATNAWTLVGGTGVTVSGTATVSAASYTDFLVTFNRTAGTVGIQRIGSGTK